MPKENMVPIKVIFGKNAKGRADYPDFNRIDSEVRKNMPWSYYIDTYGIQWHYDKVQNLGTGHDFGACCSLVPKDFAEAAAGAFPDEVSIMSEADWEDFYDNRSHIYEPEEQVDNEVLQSILVRVQLEERGIGAIASQELLARRSKAMNPNDDAPGIRKNKKKTWALLKQELGITIHPNHRKP